ncbi:MAG TPA: hypothetical protein VMD07_05890, partial [Candidatus Acidoferrales bacterium]|nr:hypothetical protein [Candidatus Acidoferrales bacterium]
MLYARLLISAVMFFLAWSTVRADPVDTSLGLTVDGFNASHALQGSVEHFDIPFPLVFADARYKQLEAQVQTLPALPISLGGGSQQTQLGVLLAEGRYYITPHVMIGAGTTLLNQVSNFSPTVFRFGGGLTYRDATTERSRVAGARFSAGYLDPRTGVSFVAAIAPKMHGRVHDECYETNNTGLPASPCFLSGEGTFGSNEYETASEIDVTLQVWRPLGHRAEWMYGWRYLNFVGSIYYPTQLDTDQNLGTGPEIGIRWH